MTILISKDVCRSDFQVLSILWVEELGALKVLEVSTIKHVLIVPLALDLRSSSLKVCNSCAFLSASLIVTNVMACEEILLCGVGGHLFSG